jgi:hypothetical protein
MGLFDMTDGSLVPIEPTSFADEGVLERTHLQAAIRQHIQLLGEDLLVVSEEFGSFEDAHRRIDLLCVDRDARPVVVELKRTADGGHMELQALRYAAMISAMTFDDLVNAFETYLDRFDPEHSFEARTRLLTWLESVEGEEPVIQRDVRVILASADFSKEIMTTALWLNEVFSTDIRCVRLRPYRLDGRLLLNVEQVIPLPEAEEFTVRLRRREAATRGATTTTRDYTRYVVRTREGSSQSLNKRQAVLHMVEAVHAGGATPTMIETAIPGRFFAVDGTLEGDDLEGAFLAVYPNANLRRWFVDSPLHHSGQTWVISNQWGTNTEPALAALAGLVPDSGIEFEVAL